MSDQTESDVDDNALRSKLVAETARISWSELQRFFAQGRLKCVNKNSDLVEVAYRLASNDTHYIDQSVQDRVLASVSDTQARKWHQNQTVLWAVVVAPWILVQEPKDNS